MFNPTESSFATGIATDSDLESVLDSLLEETGALNLDGTDDFFDSLDDLISDGVANIRIAREARKELQQLQQQHKKLQKQLKDRASSAIPAPARTWTIHSITALFDVQHCSHCGTEHSHFQGLFVKKSSCGVIQYTKTSVSGMQSYPNIPHTSERNTTDVEFCECCIAEFVTADVASTEVC